MIISFYQKIDLIIKKIAESIELKYFYQKIIFEN